MEVYKRKMLHSDIEAVNELVNKTLSHRSMLKVYEESEIAVWQDLYVPSAFETILDTCHAYLLIEQGTERILACGYINLLDDKHTAHIGMVFTDFQVRNMGLGKRIIEILENDEYAKIADKIILSFSMSAYRFYRKLGYVCKDNEYQVEKDFDIFSIPMEKNMK